LSSAVLPAWMAVTPPKNLLTSDAARAAVKSAVV
jgi:hypothetical protein